MNPWPLEKGKGWCVIGTDDSDSLHAATPVSLDAPNDSLGALPEVSMSAKNLNSSSEED